MKHPSRTLVLVFVLVLVVALLAACGQGGEEPQAEPGETKGETQPAEPEYADTLVIAIAKDTDTFDNLYTTWSTDMHDLMYEPVLGQDFDAKLGDGLAESWNVSDDGLTITIKLKEGIKFHDGTPLTAQAVADYFKLLTDPEIDSPSAGDFAWAANPEAVDDRTVVFHLEKPKAYALMNLTWGGGYGGIMSAQAWKEHGPQGDNTYGTKVTIGTGPFKLQEWIPGDRQVAVRNEDYNWAPSWENHEGPAYLKKVIYRIIPDAATRLAELESGNVHVLLDVPTEHVQRLQNMPGVTLRKDPSWAWGDIMFNTQSEHFSDVRVRQAVNLALDREQIVQAAFFGLAEPLFAYVPPRFGQDAVVDKEAYRYDVEAAKQLLAEAGYPDGFETTLAVENRTELVRVAELVADYLKDIGITAEIMQMDSAAWNDFIRSGDHELYLKRTSWFSLDILPWFLHSNQIPHPGHARWNDPKTDDFFDRAESQPTLEQRSAIYREAQEYLIEQAVWAPIWSEYSFTAVRNEVEGLEFHPWYGFSRLVNVRVKKTE